MLKFPQSEKSSANGHFSLLPGTLEVQLLPARNPPSEPRPPVTSSKTLANVNRPEQPRPVFYPPLPDVFSSNPDPVASRGLRSVLGFLGPFCPCCSLCMLLLSLVCIKLFVSDDDSARSLATALLILCSCSSVKSFQCRSRNLSSYCLAIIVTSEK